MATHPISIDSAGGEYMETVLVVGWVARPGDRIRAGDLLVTVETAKAATEIEADRDGWLAEILFAEGQEAPVGAVLGTIADEKPAAPVIPDAMQQARDASQIPDRSQDVAGSAGDTVSARHPSTRQNPRDDAEFSNGVALARRPGERVIASPLARRVAAAAGLDLAAVAGSGPHGRIKERDVKAALAARPLTPDMDVPRPAPKPEAASLPRAARPTTLILLHGFGADRLIWRQVLPLLGTGIETLSLDLPGHGAEAMRSAATIEDIAFRLSDRLEAMGVESAHLVGHSLGGAAALALARLGGLSVRSVTLLAPGGLGPEINGGFIAGIAHATMPQALERWLTVMVGDPAVLPTGYARAVLRQVEKTGNRDAMAAMAESLFPEGTQGFDLVPALAGLTVPTRLVWGRLDRVIPPAHAARAPGFAAVHLLEGIGHVPHMEAPALTARLIMETVRSAG